MECLYHGLAPPYRAHEYSALGPHTTPNHTTPHHTGPKSTHIPRLQSRLPGDGFLYCVQTKVLAPSFSLLFQLKTVQFVFFICICICICFCNSNFWTRHICLFIYFLIFCWNTFFESIWNQCASSRHLFRAENSVQPSNQCILWSIHSSALIWADGQGRFEL